MMIAVAGAMDEEMRLIQSPGRRRETIRTEKATQMMNPMRTFLLTILLRDISEMEEQSWKKGGRHKERKQCHACKCDNA